MASNITKNFKAKAGLRMSAGGVLDPVQQGIQEGVQKVQIQQGVQKQLAQNAYDANQLQRGAAFQFGTTDPSGLGRGANATMASSMTDTASQPYTPGGVGDPHATGASFAPTRTGLAAAQPSRSRLMAPSLAPDPMKKGLRAGGVVDPEQSEVYEIEGPGDGSGVDDETQVNVHGKKINVSKGERFAVFPAKVPAEAIEEFIESQTGEPSATAGGRGLREGMRAMTGAQGSTIDPRELRPEFRSAAQTPVIEPAAKPSTENLRTVNAERAATKAAEGYKPAMNAGSANDALRAAGKLPGGPSVAAPAATPSASASAAEPVSLSRGQRWEQAGRNAGKAVVKNADTVKSTLKGAAGATALGLPEFIAPRHAEFFNDPDVSTWDKTKQLGRELVREGAGVAAGAVGAGAGSVAAPVVGTAVGGVGGYVGGKKAAEWATNKVFGESPAEAYEKKYVTDPKILNTAISGKTLEGKSHKDLPQASYGNEGRRGLNSDIAVTSDQSRAEALAQSRNEIRANQLGLSTGQLDVLRKTTGVDTVPEGFSNGSWTSKNDVAGDYNDTLRNGDAQRLADGQGIASMRQKDGSYKNITVDGNPVYTGADGKPTTSWYDTQAYKDAVSRAQQDKLTLRSMQQDRLMRDLGDDIKDPRVKASAIAGLAAMNEQDKTAADKAYKAQGLRVQQAQLERDLRKDAQAQTNHEQTFSAGRDDKFKARVDTLINQMSTVDGKVDGAKAANLQKYAAQIPREIVRDEKTGKAREMDDNEYFDFLLDNFAVDQITGEAGTHLFTPEKDWQGERAQWKKTSPGLSRVLHGSPMQSVAYEDPVSKRVVYASDIEKLSPRQQAIFNSRVNNPR